MTEQPHPLILLLDDQHLVRAGISALIHLTEPRASIVEASTYEEATARLKEGGIDIAFLDIDLKGGASGLDVLDYIRDRQLDTRAIMLSGNDHKDTVMKALAAGASGYIVKDMDSEGLFRRALDTVFGDGIFLPATVMGRGGYSPSASAGASSIEDMGLSGRVVEVLYYVCQGLPNKSIANKMKIEEGTIRKDYMPRLFRAFKVARRTEMIVEVSRRGLRIPAPDLAKAAA